MVFPPIGPIKHRIVELLRGQAIARLCRQVGHTWRAGPLDPQGTLLAFVQQILDGALSCRSVHHAVGADFSGSAYCQARQRLPRSVFQRLLQDVGAAGADRADLWHGRRAFYVDGSSFSMPDTPELREHFDIPGGCTPGVGFPVGHLLVLFDAAGGFLLDLIPGPWRTGDLADLPALCRHLRAGDLLIGDAIFECYTVFALLEHYGLAGLFSLHGGRRVDWREDIPERIEWLGHDDQLVEYRKPSAGPAWLDPTIFAALPPRIRVRQVRRWLDHPLHGGRFETLVTTLTDPQEYAAADLVAGKRNRWMAETNLRHLKQQLGLDTLTCGTLEGIHKEALMIGLVYNLVRLLMQQAAMQQQVAVDRISFADALACLRHSRRLDTLPVLQVNPLRQGRWEPRQRRRRPKPYKWMTQPREQVKDAMRRKASGFS